MYDEDFTGFRWERKYTFSESIFNGEIPYVVREIFFWGGDHSSDDDDAEGRVDDEDDDDDDEDD